jgi:Family of unknown function (DUF5985)
MAELVYVLCAVASVFCAILLIRGYLKSRLRMALWAALCFSGLAVNNVLLFLDLVVAPEIDLSELRGGVALIAMSLLVFGLVTEET